MRNEKTGEGNEGREDGETRASLVALCQKCSLLVNVGSFEKDCLRCYKTQTSLYPGEEKQNKLVHQVSTKQQCIHLFIFFSLQNSTDL